MPNNQFINLEELSVTTQALLSKINEQSNLKVNKHNVSAEYSEGTKIAEIEDVEIYAPIQEIDTSNLATQDNLENLYNSISYDYMKIGRDYVTAGQKTGTTRGECATIEGLNNIGFGQYSHVEGYKNAATGNYAHAEGYQTKASGIYSHAEGESTEASNYYTHAEGQLTKASGLGAHAEGMSTTASGDYSHTEGQNTIASATGAHAEGRSSKATGSYAHAEGYTTTASGAYSHAEGSSTTADGQSAHSEGNLTRALGMYSHAEGLYTIAQRQSQHVFGEYNILDASGTTASRGTYVEIVGRGTSPTSRANARTLDWSGNEVLAGKLTIGTAPTANMDVTTKQYVDGAISTAIGNVNSFNVNIVSGDLPTTNIDTHTIYFKSNSTTGSNVYDEYMYINDNWELIGSTAIDLTPYALSANLATVATSGDYDDLLDAPAAELDVNVENMLDNFNLDYTSNSINLNAAGVICKEITITDSGIVSQSLNAGCIYHFTGDLTELTITLNSTAGLAYYNFDFTTGSNVPVINLPNTVIMQDDYTISANKHYEISILNNYGAVAIWTN